MDKYCFTWNTNEKDQSNGTICPRSSDPFYIVTYYIKLVTTSWIISTLVDKYCFTWTTNRVR